MSDKSNPFEKVLQRHEKQDRAKTKPATPKPQKSKAKRSDPDYKQVGVYLKKDIYLKARSKAVAKELEISQLIEDLLKDLVESE